MVRSFLRGAGAGWKQKAAANGFVVVWADGEDEPNVGTPLQPHTPPAGCGAMPGGRVQVVSVVRAL